jgi:hypothetical protein
MPRPPEYTGQGLLVHHLTLAVQVVIQLYVVPRVETRKRREDRWERNVLEFGDLLTTSLGDRAGEARSAQWLFRLTRQETSKLSESDQAKIAQHLSERGRDARQASTVFVGVMRARVDWLADRIEAFGPAADEIIKFRHAWMTYQLRALRVSGWYEDEDQTDTAIEDGWDKESKARTELISQVKLLADLPHPPRASLRRRVHRLITRSS